MNYGNRKITPGRIQKLMITANDMIKATGLFDSVEEYKTEELYNRYEVSSTKDLTIAQADEEINRLLKMLGENNNMASFGQKEKIKALRKLMNWSKEGLWKFIQRQTKQRKSLGMITSTEATQIIIGLQRIYADANQQLYDKLNRASPQWISSPEGRAQLQTQKQAANE